MNLKEIRLNSNKTQNEVAKELNIGRASYNRYELGLTDPSIETLINMAKYFHTTIDNLIGFEVPYLLDTSTLSYIQKQVVDQIKNLSDENCKRVQDFITGIMIAEVEKQAAIQKLINKGV